MACGVFLLSRLTAGHGDGVWRVIERRMDQLLPVATGLIEEMFARYEEMPFGLEVGAFVDFATTQFQRRFARIEKARRKTLAEVCRLGVPDASSAPA